MASPIRPHERLEFALIMNFSDTSQPAFSKGDEVKFNSSDTLLTATSGSDAAAIGIAVAGNLAGRTANIAMYGSPAIVPVTVGTGGATRGALAVRNSTGFTDAASVGGGTTAQYIRGQFTQTGVAGDVVGLNIGFNPAAVKA
jgi:hypothetical protein